MHRHLQRLKYYTSHAARYVLTMTGVAGRRPGLHGYLQLLSYLSNIVLLTALGLGLYIRWTVSQNIAILLFAFIGLFLFVIACALVYYFSLDAIGFSLSRLWIGCLLGVVAFTYADVDSLARHEALMNWLLMASLALRLLWNVIDHELRILPHDDDSPMIGGLDWLEIVGMTIAATFLGRDFVAIALMILAFAFSIVTVRLKSYISLLNFMCLIVVVSRVYCSQLLEIGVNRYALMCFAGRLGFEPILDFHFGRLTTLERWQPFLSSTRLGHRVLILALVGLQVTFYAIVARQLPHHKEWFVVVPIFAALSVIWFCYHIVFVITCWQLATRMRHCNVTYAALDEDGRNMNRIMAAKGLRHFGLISRRLMVVTVLSTVVLAAVSWQTKSALSVSLYFLLIPTELAINSLLFELSSALGGTCIGYAVLAPATTCNVLAGQTSLLPTSAAAELATAATHILGTVQQFFSHHLIASYGCDYSSGGLTLDSLHEKLAALFQQCTADGPRYDTYVVYYSGPVHTNGNWALADERVLTFELLCEWWQQRSAEDSDSRLVLILDTLHSHQWLRAVRSLKHGHVALQTCRYAPPSDPETGGGRVGDFSADWAAHNAGRPVDWRAADRLVGAAYGVSRRWTDFTFHLPTEQESSQHWDASFPRRLKPLVSLANFSCVGALCCCCDGPLRCVRRWRMRWLPPAECDTGHGFKLLRS